MSNQKQDLNTPFVKDLEEGGELSKSAPLTVVFDTDLSDVTFYGLNIVDEKNSDTQFAGGLLYKAQPDQTHFETTFKKLNCYADNATGARALAYIIDKNQQLKMFTGLTYVLKD